MTNLKPFLRRHLSAKYSPLLISGIIAVLVIIGLVLIVDQKKTLPSEPRTDNSSSITKNYDEEARAALTDYQLFLDRKNSTVELNNRRTRLLSLKVARENQALHLNLVMIADALLTSTEDSGAKSRAEIMIKKILVDNPDINQ